MSACVCIVAYVCIVVYLCVYRCLCVCVVACVTVLITECIYFIDLSLILNNDHLIFSSLIFHQGHAAVRSVVESAGGAR